MSDNISGLDTSNMKNLPFALRVLGGAERVRVPDSHLQYKEAKLRAFLEKSPVLGDLVADSETKNETLTHTDNDTVVHDGNKLSPDGYRNRRH